MAKKRLITESSVRDMPRGGELVLGREDLATPSALDLAFERGIRVRYADGSSGAAAPSTGDPLWSRVLASDGTYVVTVRGGRASIVRLTDAGPQALQLEGGG